MFIKIGPEFHENRARIIMFEKTGLEFQFFKGQDRDSNACKNRATIPMLDNDRMGPEYHCLTE